MKKDDIINSIANRITSEFDKHPQLDWAGIAARKIYSEHLSENSFSSKFSSEKLEQAYKDGVRDALAKGYGNFNEENY